MPDYFTCEEAEALLPQINALLPPIQASHQKITSIQQELAVLNMRVMSNGHGLHDRIAALHKELNAEEEIRFMYLERLHKLGCELMNMQMGWVDFPSLRNGKEVTLCWRPGEEHIRFWHEPDVECETRQPL